MCRLRLFDGVMPGAQSTRHQHYDTYLAVGAGSSVGEILPATGAGHDDGG